MNQNQQEIRQRAIDARAALSDAERELASEIIADKVIRAPWFQRANYLGCYLSTPLEVNTGTIIARAWRMKKRIFVPVIEKKRQMQFQEITPDTDLRLNDFGLFEPDTGESVTPRMLDVVVTPVVAYDDDKHRIGMGGGYFDTSFAFLRHRTVSYHPKLVGVAFACQKVAKISPNPWDIPLFATISET